MAHMLSPVADKRPPPPVCLNQPITDQRGHRLTGRGPADAVLIRQRIKRGQGSARGPLASLNPRAQVPRNPLPWRHRLPL